MESKLTPPLVFVAEKFCIPSMRITLYFFRIWYVKHAKEMLGKIAIRPKNISEPIQDELH